MRLSPSFELTWDSSQIPLVDGEVYSMINYGPELRFNRGIPTIEHANETYGWFEVEHLPEIQDAILLESFNGEHTHTMYMTSLEYDEGQPYFHVLFVFLDTVHKKMYRSWVCGTGQESHIDIDPSTFSFQLIDDIAQKYLRTVDVYQKKLGAVRKVRSIVLGA